MVPALVFVGIYVLITSGLQVVDGQPDEDFEELMRNDTVYAIYLALIVGFLVIPAIGAWLAARWLRARVLTDTGKATAGVVAALFVVGIPLFDYYVYEYDFLYSLWFQLGAFVVIAVLTVVGAGAVFGWALRSALEQVKSLGRVTTRALPLLLLFTVFGFLTNEIWQMSAGLSGAGMWWTVALFALVAALFLLSMIPGEISGLVDARGEVELHGTPFGGEPEAARVPLRPTERANLVLVLVCTHLLQALFVAVVMFGFFVAFGSVAVKRDLMKTWSGRDLTGGQILGVKVAAPAELLQVALFIAAFSALYFVASTATDTLYRGQFFDPLTRHMAVSLAARDVYLAKLPSAPMSRTRRRPRPTGEGAKMGASLRRPKP
ncbi:hypothetical protein [Actinokineospora sp. HUAS TT18]|uniref:hypothetical protein n=1 Tax=Actinokineospora sp. HUAS TT18 TaxID=3447451 RepID=UPI003F525995